MIKKILVGLMSGIISGLFTAGGGLILVPAFLYTLKMEPKKARATSIFCILPMVIVTAFFYVKVIIFIGKLGCCVHWEELLGGLLGAKLLNRIPDKYLKIIFSGFLIYAGIHMLLP